MLTACIPRVVGEDLSAVGKGISNAADKNTATRLDRR